MSHVSSMVTLLARDYDAVLFDLDGVLTRTADIHAAAWKSLFDAFLEQRASGSGKPFVAFDIDADYREYVDGKPREDGVAAFLASRGIDLPWASADTPSGDQTIQGLGQLKDRYFQEQLAQHGAAVFETSVSLVHALRELGIKTAVVSSSRNCEAVLQAAGIDHLFDARVDGQDMGRLNLAGKPAADCFLEAARRLDVDPFRAVVVEDAIAGVQAGHAGAFGFVIGVDRGANRQALIDAGAHVVVDDLKQVRLVDESASTWSLVYDNYDGNHEGVREALCCLGNGYFATRGAMPWAVADERHYPGTYLAGGYNRLRTDIEGVTVENEDLVNLPNWLVVQFRIAGQDWFDIDSVTLLSCRQELDLRRGMLLRDIRFEDAQGRISTVSEQRLVCMHDMHLAAMHLSLTAENWSGMVELRSGIDGQVVNAGAKLYRKFNNRHLHPVKAEALDAHSVGLLVRTCQSEIGIALAARTRLFLDGKPLDVDRTVIQEPGYIAQDMAFQLDAGTTVALEKIVALHTSRDPAISECNLAARKTLGWAHSFDALAAEHTLAWKHLWRRFDIHLRPAQGRSGLNLLMLLRLNVFHLLQTVSPQSIGLDIGVPARGWTGEAYQGHIFWDELFIFPFFNLRVPQITRSLLMYRVRRLDEARAAARRAGLQGAMFSWQSSSDGQEETQEANLNPHSQRWVTDNSYLQRHVGSAIVYNVWHYFQVTSDLDFMHSYGAELILDIARFWSSM
nr:beta-phosphoglucomutase family hydrolase [Pseudomonas sp.]